MSRSIIEITNNTGSTVSVQSPEPTHSLGHIDILNAASSIQSGASKVQAATIGDPGGGHHTNTGYIKIVKGADSAFVFIKKVSKQNIDASVEGDTSLTLDFSHPGQSGDPDYHGVLITVS